METNPQNQGTETPGQETGYLAQIWGIVWSVSSYFSSAQETQVRDALTKASEGEEDWPNLIPGDVWKLIVQRASAENISTLAHMSRVNKYLASVLTPYLKKVQENFQEDTEKNEHFNKSDPILKGRIRAVTSQSSLEEALGESEVHLFQIEITEGDETDFTIQRGKEFSDTTVEALGAVNVVVKHPGFVITSKSGASLYIYEGCVGKATDRGVVYVFDRGRGEASNHGTVTVDSGGWGFAYEDGFVTVTAGGQGEAHTGGVVTVETDGQGYAVKGGSVIVKAGGDGYAHKDGIVTVEADGKGHTEVEGGGVIVKSGGQGYAKGTGGVIVQEGGRGYSETGGMFVVKAGGRGFANQGGTGGVDEEGVGFASQGGWLMVSAGGLGHAQEGGQIALQGGGTAFVHSGGKVMVEENGASVKIVADKERIETWNRFVYLDGKLAVCGSAENDPIPDDVTVTDERDQPIELSQ